MNFETYLRNLKGSTQRFVKTVYPILTNNNIFNKNNIPDFNDLIEMKIPLNYSLFITYHRYELPDWYREIFKASDDGKILNVDFFSDLFLKIAYANVKYEKLYNKTYNYYIKKFHLKQENAILLETLMMSPETKNILSQPMIEGDSKMEYREDIDEILPPITEKELYILVNNYSKKEAGCIGFCKLKSKPTIVLNGTYAHKRLINVNPFRFLNKESINKYGLGIELLINVGDLLMGNDYNSTIKSLELIINDYKESSRLTRLLYADCLIGYHIYGTMDRRFYPLNLKWSAHEEVESIDPLKILDNMGWVFFDMIINLSYVIHKLKKSINADLQVNLLETNMNKFMTYESSAADGYLSNYYNEKKKLSTNCLLSTLMEACVLQESGISNNKIFLRLEMSPSARQNSNSFERIYSVLESQFPGSTNVTHWSTRFEGNKFRSYFDICTENEINFGEHKTAVAMAILYPILQLSLRMILRSLKPIILRIYKYFETNEDLSNFLFKTVTDILELEEDTRFIVEENIANTDYEKELKFYKKYVSSTVVDVLKEVKEEKKSRFGNFLEAVKNNFPFINYFKRN